MGGVRLLALVHGRTLPRHGGQVKLLAALGLMHGIWMPALSTVSATEWVVAQIIEELVATASAVLSDLIRVSFLRLWPVTMREYKAHGRGVGIGGSHFVSLNLSTDILKFQNEYMIKMIII